MPADHKLFSGNGKNGVECDVSYEGVANCYEY